MSKEKYLEVTAMHFEMWIDLAWFAWSKIKNKPSFGLFRADQKKNRIDVWKTFHPNIAISVVVPVMYSMHVYDRVLGESD